MKKTLSLKEPKEFQKAINKGNWYGGDLISTYIISNSNNKNKTNFIGLAVGKKVGKAVKRNKIKRVIREAYYSLEDRIINEKGYTFVFVWRSKASFDNLNIDILKNDIERAFKKAGLII